MLLGCGPLVISFVIIKENSSRDIGLINVTYTAKSDEQLLIFVCNGNGNSYNTQ